MNNVLRIFYNKLAWLGICLFLFTLSTNMALAQTANPQRAKVISLDSNSNDAANQIMAKIQGDNITLSNPKIVKGMIGRRGQIAIFEEGKKAGFGMDTGVLFSTGNARTLLTSKNSNDAKGDKMSASYSDPDLIGISDRITADVVVYTFDVKLDEDMDALRISFQFGSEEYPTFIGGQFNDAFGFFVSGGNLTETVNMARLPISDNVISVQTVNDQDPISAPYFINNGYIGNGTPTNDGPVFIEFNGITTLIQYELPNLEGGETYHFKIAIGDANDGGVDSGVLIEKIEGLRGADLVIDKKIDKPNISVGDEVEFTLIATNNGPNIANKVVVKDILPSGYTYNSATAIKRTYDRSEKVWNESPPEPNPNYNPATGIWEIGPLNHTTEERILKIKATVNGSGEYLNTAIIESEREELIPGTNTDTADPVFSGPIINLIKDGVFNDENDNKLADIGETITYTFSVTNSGNMPLELNGQSLVDPLLGSNKYPQYINGDANNDGWLNEGETWVYTANYDITDEDIKNKGVYNQAFIQGTGTDSNSYSKYSKPTNPLQVEDEGYDSNRPNHTFVPLKVEEQEEEEEVSFLITNPNIYHRVK